MIRWHGHSRVTIRKVLGKEYTGYSPRQRQFYPALEGYLPIIDGWLEGDKGEPRKQRHTARRIYHRLVNEHGYAGSEEAVRRYVRLTKPRLGLDGPEVFVIQGISSAKRIKNIRPLFYFTEFEKGGIIYTPPLHLSSRELHPATNYSKARDASDFVDFMRACVPRFALVFS